MSKFECSICFGKYTHKKYFICKDCKTTICCTCLKPCLIVYGTTIPRCPSCNQNISYLYLTKVFSKKFVKEDLYKHLSSIEYDVLIKEKIKLISELLQRMILSIKENKKLEYTSILNCKMYSTLFMNQRSIPTIRMNLYSNVVDNVINIYLNNLKELLIKFENGEVECKLEDIISDTLLLVENIVPFQKVLGLFSDKLPEYFDETLLKKYILLSQSTIKQEIGKIIRDKDKLKNRYLFRCTNCEYGFIDNNYYCEGCNKKFCEKCLQPLVENHECKKEDIETLEIILKETKPCPNCYTRIYKISGCSQMFCTYCKTGFDWITGKKILNNLHNPHRMEWLQNGGANELPDFNCIDNYHFIMLERYGNNKIITLYYYSNHIRYLIRKNRQGMNEEEIENSELILLTKYLFSKHVNEKIENNEKYIEKFKLNKIYLTESSFKRKIANIIKKKNKCEIYLDIYSTIDQIIRSSLIRIDQILALYRDHITGSVELDQESIDQIETLTNNCYEFVYNVQNERIVELEQQLEFTFDKLVIFDENINAYVWNNNEIKSKNYQEVIDFINLLLRNPKSTTNVEYKKLNYSEITSLNSKPVYSICKYIQKNLTNKIEQQYKSNLDDLNLSLKEKNLVYTLLFA